MKNIFAALALASLPILGLAQTQTAADAKPAAKSAPSKPAASHKPAAKPAGLARGAQKAVEENTPIEEDTTTQLTPAELEVARVVYVGDMKCELGATVSVKPMRREGFFLITTKGYRFRMHPAESRTGAIRLEDPRRGAMWLQLGNKSMLMSQKLGQRIADECQSPEQVTMAEALKKNPPISILEPLPAGRPAEAIPPGTPSSTILVLPNSGSAAPAR
ncbi:MAG TPA: hypothetical protein VLJ86_18015 [Ramlibacter sp.]|nr:hypothetical protein [Ramlibacter sp.]